MRPLNPNERRFVLEYLKDEKRNATRAAERAGYKDPNNLGPRLLKRPLVAAAIAKEIQTFEGSIREEVKAVIATKIERQQWWTRLMQDEGMELRDRLKASQLLGESEGDFSSKVEVTGKGGGPIQSTSIDFSRIDDKTLHKLAHMTNGAGE